MRGKVEKKDEEGRIGGIDNEGVTGEKMMV